MNANLLNDQNINNSIIIDFKQGDVNGNNIPDNIYLVGNRPYGPESFLMENIAIIIIDGQDGSRHEIIPKYNAGYTPSIILRDFTGDGINNILVSIFSGSTGGESYYYIYSFINNKKEILFDFEEFNDIKPYEIIFEDNYKVRIVNDREYTIDLTNRSQIYKDYIYDETGRLRRQVRGRISPLISLVTHETENNGLYEIEAKQRLIGYYSADLLGELITRLRFNGERFEKIYDQVILYENR